MKLIIDIPYEAYYTFKCDLGKGNLNALAEIVANGTPYNPTEDAISRSALKEAIKDHFDNLDAYFPSAFIKEVDNAPTVVVDCKNCDGYEAGYSAGVRDTERPQGEWIGNAFDEHHCNRCGHPALWEEEPDDYYEVQSRFCPNCGADMRKGGAE